MLIADHKTRAVSQPTKFSLRAFMPFALGMCLLLAPQLSLAAWLDLDRANQAPANNVPAGNTVTYSVRLTNNGPDAAVPAPQDHQGQIGTTIRITVDGVSVAANRGLFSSTGCDPDPEVADVWRCNDLFQGQNQSVKFVWNDPNVGNSKVGIAGAFVFVSADGVRSSGGVSNTASFSTRVGEDPLEVGFDPSSSAVNVAETAGQANLVVNIASVPSSLVTVNYTTEAISATAGEDFQATSGTLRFAPPLTSNTIRIPIINDAAVEADESFRVVLSGVSAGGTLNNFSSAVVTINSEDAAPAELNFATNSTTTSVDESAGNATLTVSRTGNTTSAVTVGYTTRNGSASAGSDFTSTSGTLSFAANQRSAVINVPIANDNQIEADEDFTVVLTNPSAGATVGNNATAKVTIVNDDAAAAEIVVAQVSQSVAESAGSVAVSVRRSVTTDTAVTVGYRTNNGSATAGDDFSTVNGSLSFAAGQTTQTVSVPILNDSVNEADEAFTLVLSNPSSNAVLGNNQQTSVTITDDDALGSIGFQNASLSPSIDENAGSISLQLERTGATGAPATVNFATSNGTATAGSDYTASSGTATFPAGQATTTVRIPILDDSVDETGGDEEFIVTLTAADGGTLGSKNVARVAIVDNDDPLPQLAFGAASLDRSVSEGDGVITLTVTRSGSTANAVSIAFAAANGTATGGSDFTNVSGTLNFAVGVATQTIDVTLLDDTLLESTTEEVFTITLSNPNGAVLGANRTSTISIADNESMPVVNFDGQSVERSVNEDVGSISLTVNRTGPANTEIGVDYATQSGTATAGDDFTSNSGTLTFAAGVGSQTIEVVIADDAQFEGADAESFTVVLGNPTGATLADATISTISVNDNDTQGTIEFTAATVTSSVSEDAGSVTLTLNRTGSSAGAASVDYASEDGSAVAGSDYASTSGTAIFADGEMTQTISIDVVDDAQVESANETFTVRVSNPVGATAGNNTLATVTIADNDEAAVIGFSDIATLVTANEGAGTVSITLNRTGSTATSVSVDYATTDDTATAGTDYTAASGTATFAAGEASKTIVLGIIDDALFEAGDNETFRVTFSNPVGATLVQNAVITITIAENDKPATGEEVLGAAAGQDLVVVSTDGADVAVTLTALQAANLVSYQWSRDGAVVATQPVAQTNLGPGKYLFLLTVTDAAGAVTTDELAVTVTRADVASAAALADLENLTAQQRSVARSLDNICVRLNTAAQLSADQEDLRGICSNLLTQADTGEQATALKEMSGEQITALATNAIEIPTIQFRNIAARTRELREGSRGMSVAGLNLNVDGQAIPNFVVTEVLQNIIGGNAGDGYASRLGVFISGNISFGEKDGTNRESAYDFKTSGLTLGVDFRVSDNFVLGGGLGYGMGDTDFGQDRGEQESEAISGLVYGSFYNDRYYLDGLVSYGQSSHDSDRRIRFSDGTTNIDRVAKGSTDGNQWSTGGEFGLQFGQGPFTINPNASVFYTKLTIDEFAESGASGLNMAYDKQDAESLTMSAGVMVDYVFNTTWGVIRPYARVDFVREMENDGQVINLRFVNDPFASDPNAPSPGIVLETEDPDDQYVTVGLGLSMQLKSGLGGFIDWERVEGYDNLSVDSFAVGLRFERSF